jgi:hypothetical protein
MTSTSNDGTTRDATGGADGQSERAKTESTVTLGSLLDSGREIFEQHTTTAVVGGFVLLAAAAGLVGYALTTSLAGAGLAVVGTAVTGGALRRQGATPRIVLRMVVAAVLWLVFAPTAARVRQWPDSGAAGGAVVLVLIPVAFSVWAVATARST